MATTGREKFQALSQLIKSKVPSFENKLKSKSFLFSKIISPIISTFNKDFTSDYITTIGTKIYWPSEEIMNSDGAWKVLAHEYVHICDFKRNRAGFVIGYLFPQIFTVLALGALGAFWSLWCLLFLTFLLCLLPLPAPWRTLTEMRGYTMSMAVDIWEDPASIDKEYVEWVSEHFTSMAYYLMNPNKEAVIKEINARLASIRNNEVLVPIENEPYRDVYQLLTKLGG